MLAGASPLGREKLDFEERSASGARNAAVAQIIVVAIPSARVEKSLVSRAGACFLTERESSVGAGANP